MLIGIYNRTLTLPLPTNILINLYSIPLLMNKLIVTDCFLNNVSLTIANLSSCVSYSFKEAPFTFLFVSSSIIHISFSAFVFMTKSKQSLNTFTKKLQRALSFSSYGDFKMIQFVGFRYRQRWFRFSQVLRFKLGYHSKVWFKTPSDFISIIRKVSSKKRNHIFFSNDVESLRDLIYSIYAFKPAISYKGSGVNFKEQPMVLKEGKKTLW